MILLLMLAWGNSLISVLDRWEQRRDRRRELERQALEDEEAERRLADERTARAFREMRG